MFYLLRKDYPSPYLTIWLCLFFFLSYLISPVLPSVIGQNCVPKTPGNFPRTCRGKESPVNYSIFLELKKPLGKRKLHWWEVTLLACSPTKAWLTVTHLLSAIPEPAHPKPWLSCGWDRTRTKHRDFSGRKYSFKQLLILLSALQTFSPRLFPTPRLSSEARGAFALRGAQAVRLMLSVNQQQRKAAPELLLSHRVCLKGQGQVITHLVRQAADPWEKPRGRDLSQRFTA